MTTLPEQEIPVGERLGSERLFDEHFPPPVPHPAHDERQGFFANRRTKKAENAAKQPPPPAPERPTAAKQAARNWRGPVSSWMELAGIALVTTGCALIAVWLAFIVAGIALVLLGVATGWNVTK